MPDDRIDQELVLFGEGSLTFPPAPLLTGDRHLMYEYTTTHGLTGSRYIGGSHKCE
jgi:hypothetical protein